MLAPVAIAAMWRATSLTGNEMFVEPPSAPRVNAILLPSIVALDAVIIDCQSTDYLTLVATAL